ncbi:MAG: dihydroneopterin aldolase, partial [Anaerolineaceae bacterium]
MDKVFIKDLMVRGVIGISDRERADRQDIVINVVMFSDTTRAGQTDDIDDCVNYRTVAKQIIAHAEGAARYTVEALAADVAEICLRQPGVDHVQVRIEKP